MTPAGARGWVFSLPAPNTGGSDRHSSCLVKCINQPAERRGGCAACPVGWQLLTGQSPARGRAGREPLGRLSCWVCALTP